MRRYFFLLLNFFLLSVNVLAGQSLSDLLPFFSERETSDFILDKEISGLYDTEFLPAFLPESGLSSVIRDQITENRMNTGSELLVLIDPLPPRLKNLSKDRQLLIITNILRSVTSLEGIEYFSVSRNKVRTLFTESWRIESLNNHEKLADPMVNKFQKGTEQFYIHQKDTSFGSNQSLITYRHGENAVSLSFLNKTPMYYFSTIKAVDPDQLQMHILIILNDDNLLLYGFCGGQSPDVSLIKRKVSTSLYNRIKALYGWFTMSLD